MLRQILELTSKSFNELRNPSTKSSSKLAEKQKKRRNRENRERSDKTNSGRVLPSRAPIVAFAFRCGGDGGNRTRAGSRHFLVFIHLSGSYLSFIQEEGVGELVIQGNCDEKATYCLNKAISTFFVFLFFSPLATMEEDFCQKV